jgi:hypothetical protein
MKTLKVALLVSTVAGAVAAGGVTYATVGYQSHAPSASTAKNAVSKATSAIKAPAAAPALPSVPTCIPDLPKGAKLDAAKAEIKQKIEALAAKAPQTPVAIPQVGNVKNVKNKLPKVLPAGELAKLPVSKLPTCKGGAEKNNSVGEPTVPGAPGLPALPNGVDCTQVPQVIKNAESKAKSISLPNGMQLGASHAHKIVVNSRAACVYTQELAGALPGMVSVDRIQTPPQVTVSELAQSLKMAGGLASVNGVETWRTPAGDGMLWMSDQGYAIRLSGTSAATDALLPGLATQLHK